MLSLVLAADGDRVVSLGSQLTGPQAAAIYSNYSALVNRHTRGQADELVRRLLCDVAARPERVLWIAISVVDSMLQASPTNALRNSMFTVIEGTMPTLKPHPCAICFRV